jgi:hypothetical protein
MDNKKLAIILGVLIAIFAISQFTGTNKSRSFDPNVLSFDDSSVDEIEITIPGSTSSSLRKTGDQWNISDGNQEFLADGFAVSSLLSELKSIKAKKIAARSEEKAANFDTNKEAATHIVVKSGGKVLADVNVGRFSFDQQSRQPISYIKKAKEDETYLVQSFLAMSTKKDFNSLRDKSFLSIDKSQIQYLELTTPSLNVSLSSFGNLWQTVDGIGLDSTAMEKYLDGLNDLKGVTFGSNNSGGLSDYSLSATLKDGNMVTVEALRTEENKFIISSSSTHRNMFESDENGLFKKVFRDLEDLLVVTGDL